MDKNITISDIARMANVNKSTVSRALNGSDKLNPETAEKIQRIAKQYNFQPNAAARSLATGSVRNIAVIVPERSISRAIITPVFPNIIYGIGFVAAQNNYDVTLITSAKEDDKEYLNLIRNRHASGFIVIISSVDDSFPYLFEKEGIPFITIGRFPGIENYVSVNNEIGGYMATKHLLSLGHRNIIIIGGNEKWFHNSERLDGARRAFTEYGLDFDACRVILNRTSMEKSYETFMEIAKEQQGGLPDAIFCLSDTAAMGIYAATYDLGISIPKDISLVGYGGQYYTKFTRPRLTTIHEEIDKLGQIATNQLLQMIHNQKTITPGIHFDPTLIVGDSTAMK